MILNAERSYMRTQEPDQLNRWLDAIDKNLRLWIDNLDRTIVAIVDGEPAGYSMWMPDKDRATIITIHVLNGARGQGLGRGLLKATIEAARAHGAAGVDLGVQHANPAQFLYEDSGFTHVSNDGEYRLYAHDFH